MIKADLHLHSLFSDGTSTIQQLVACAKQKEMDFIALTDHDNCSGVAEFLRIAKQNNILACSGIEFSASGEKEVHILGYNINIANESFNKTILAVLEKRTERINTIIDKLKKYNINITLNQKECIGRMHIAKAMVAGGYVYSVADAFNRYLAKGKLAYTPSYRLTPKDAIEAITNAGGRAVLAHPLALQKQYDLQAILQEFIGYGLSGLEVCYGNYNQEEKSLLLGYANHNNLFATGGSDYHGGNKTTEIGEGNFCVDSEKLKRYIFGE